MTKQYNDPTPIELPVAPIKRERPFALKAVCALLMFQGLSLLALVGAALAGVFGRFSANSPPPPSINFFTGISAATEMIALGVAGVILVWVSIGLWRFHPWAWRWTMISMGAFLVINLYSYFKQGETISATISLAVDVLIVFYLVQSEVRVLYIDKPQNTALPEAI